MSSTKRTDAPETFARNHVIPKFMTMIASTNRTRAIIPPPTMVGMDCASTVVVILLSWLS